MAFNGKLTHARKQYTQVLFKVTHLYGSLQNGTSVHFTYMYYQNISLQSCNTSYHIIQFWTAPSCGTSASVPKNQHFCSVSVPDGVASTSDNGIEVLP
jgi:hypothetical protein